MARAPGKAANCSSEWKPGRSFFGLQAGLEGVYSPSLLAGPRRPFPHNLIVVRRYSPWHFAQKTYRYA